MKSIIITLFLVMGININQQNNAFDYDKAWKEVQKLIDEGLPKSALEKLEIIYDTSLDEKNDGQTAKSAIYIARFTIQTDEEGIENTIEKFNKLIATNNRQVKYIIASYLGEIYQNYFNSHRWEISQRTEIDGENSNDFRTWTTQQYLKTIDKWYIFSISNKNAINIPIKEYTPIILDLESKSVLLRPTIYEVLADRAFDFYKNYSNYTVENTESFQIDKKEYFDPASAFVDLDLGVVDDNSSKQKILILYQDVLRTQIQNRNIPAVIDYDLSRLEYVYHQSVSEEKDQWYISALENLAANHLSSELYTTITAQLAQKLVENTSDSTHLVKAVALCESAIKKFPTSDGANLCHNIITNIKKAELKIFTEEVYPSNSPLLVAREYKNINKARIETIKIGADFNDIVALGDQQKIQNYLHNAKKIHSSQIYLDPGTLYTSRKIEFNHKKLDFGKYALMISDGNTESKIYQYSIFHISDLAYTTYIHEGKRMILVSDRSTGVPVKCAQVAVMRQNYNPTKRRYDFVKSGEYFSDLDGKVEIETQSNDNFMIILTHKKDVLDLHNYHYNYMPSEKREYHFAELFTDRAIYRPGQIVYYKAILLMNDKKSIPHIQKNIHVDVIFRDVNYQEITRQKLISNEFGSVNGSFVIPIGKLNGMFTIQIQSATGTQSSKMVRVEEYKRPTFEVTHEQIEGSYRLYDNIKTSGIAMTLAGTVVDGAKVRYNITRRATYPMWRWWWRSPYQSPDFQIKKGETITDAEGKYTLEFEAIPDKKVDKKDHPIFNYMIEVSVTDQRGETSMHTYDIPVGYSAFAIQSNLQNEMDIQKINQLVISATNSNNQAININGKVKISKLIEPKEVKINSYWETDTDFPLPKNIRDKYFPNYATSQDTDISKWPIDKIVVTREFKSFDSIPISQYMSAGGYKIEMDALDDNGIMVHSEQFCILTDFKKGNFPASDFMFFDVNKTELLPGQTLNVSAGVFKNPIFLHYMVEKDGKILENRGIKVSKQSQISFPIEEIHRGGIEITFFYIIHNRIFTKSFHVDVPWDNKHLEIVYETFRDKSLPGSKEEYRIKIKGLQKDKLASEMVAAMYDASLDQFVKHKWRSNYYPKSYRTINIEMPSFRLGQGYFFYFNDDKYYEVKNIIYPSLIPLIDYYGSRDMVLMSKSMPRSSESKMSVEESQSTGAEPPAQNTSDKNQKEKEIAEDPESNNNASANNIRKNLKETVFFYPTLGTDMDGNIILAFTHNEALTRWKLLTFAHSQDFKTGYDERYVQTQKNVMVFPNPPRFLRDGDIFYFTAKVSSLIDQPLSGIASIQIYDAINMQDITKELVESSPTVSFTTQKGKSEGLSWKMKIPDTKYNAITYRILVTGGDHTDGEENTLPIVTNSTLITETMPMWIGGKENKTFQFKAFKDNVSTTNKDFKYTIEYTSNPVWYAIQALPYMPETQSASTQSLSEKLYTNILASKIAHSHPKIKSVIDAWQYKDSDALISNLNKNSELKNAILEETPWVRQAMSESEQKRNIALLFDLNTLANQKSSTIKTLTERQLSNGGFPWFTGGRDDIYTTQNLLENIGHLYYLGALDINDPSLSAIISKALKYIDEELIDRYQKLKQSVLKNGGSMADHHISAIDIHYLYVKTFFKHVNSLPAAKEANNYYLEQAKKYWLKNSLYSQAMIGLVLFRNDDVVYKNIQISLKQKAFKSNELGMYWNEGNGFYWYQLPIERQALMIEFFAETDTNKDDTEAMKIWLLKNKQTNHWKTTKSTAAAIYALLLQGEEKGITSWVTQNEIPTIKVGKIDLKEEVQKSQIGTGYFKKSFSSDNISKDMATIHITNNNNSIAWGGAYYQYFERLDKVVSFSDTPLKLNKKLYKEIQTDKGKSLVEISPKSALKPGDKVLVRIELRVDRSMEYVELKDMRPSGLEPIHVISGYKYQGQLGYYESIKDLTTNFYFSYLPKGTFVFEYPMIVVHKGNFSGGIANIQSMYAPEFSSHSEGERIVVE